MQTADHRQTEPAPRAAGLPGCTPVIRRLLDGGERLVRGELDFDPVIVYRGTSCLISSSSRAAWSSARSRVHEPRVPSATFSSSRTVSG